MPRLDVAARGAAARRSQGRWRTTAVDVRGCAFAPAVLARGRTCCRSRARRWSGRRAVDRTHPAVPQPVAGAAAHDDDADSPPRTHNRRPHGAVAARCAGHQGPLPDQARGCCSTRRSATSSAVDGVTLTSSRARPTAWSANPGAARRRSGRAMLRLVEPTGGSVIFDGVDIADAQARAVAQDAPGHADGVPGPAVQPRPAAVRGVIAPGGACARTGWPRTRRPPSKRLRELLPRSGLPADGTAPIPPRVLRRPAAAHRHRPRPGGQPELIVADEPVSRARRLGAGAGDQPARGRCRPSSA